MDSKLIHKGSLDLEDVYAAEQVEWLLQWNNHLCLESDVDSTALQMQLLSVNSLKEKLKLKLDHLSDMLGNACSSLGDRKTNKLDVDGHALKARLEESENKIHQLIARDHESRRTIEELTHDLQFVTLQKEQLTIERDGLTLKLEEQESSYKDVVAKQVQQIRSVQVIISKSQQEISQMEALCRQLLVDLEGQEQVHLQQLEAQRQSLVENNEDSITCSICWVAWDAEGDHRVVSLACGHLFGDSCVRNFLMRNESCPICRQPATAEHIRFIFGRHVLPNQTQ
ncbi:E3 ubiquitin-protein ligase RNF8-like [Drosophila biarmipes]|uniref:E3 ubiquitin-protein ligase RNF8-like n=1 Tax=Drosophila biarmipes TaxID=125945 RepID=UPI0007E6F4C0|nr:E3 ubiquitin-protein ligase RNF8-like [Drosophila biarmipes]XP_050741607.1 E3 ubiquitin-protein ligase RNF8-like [Drosophila biarmipes]